MVADFMVAGAMVAGAMVTMVAGAMVTTAMVTMDIMETVAIMEEMLLTARAEEVVMLL